MVGPAQTSSRDSNCCSPSLPLESRHFLDLLKHEFSLRTECKLRIKRDEAGGEVSPKYSIEGTTSSKGDFNYATIASASLVSSITTALPGTDDERKARSPLTLQF